MRQIDRQYLALIAAGAVCVAGLSGLALGKSVTGEMFQSAADAWQMADDDGEIDRSRLYGLNDPGPVRPKLVDVRDMPDEPGHYRNGARLLVPFEPTRKSDRVRDASYAEAFDWQYPDAGMEYADASGAETSADTDRWLVTDRYDKAELASAAPKPKSRAKSETEVGGAEGRAPRTERVRFDEPAPSAKLSTAAIVQPTAIDLKPR